MTEQQAHAPEPVTQPTREELLAALADRLCRTYTHGIDLASVEETDPEEAARHRSAARRLIDLVEDAPEEDREAAFKRGYDRGREAQKRRTAADVARLEAEVAELRQDRDPEGLRARVCDLEYALHGVDTHLMGRDRKQFGAVPDWKQKAGEYLAQLIKAQRELAELQGHQPSNATRQA